MNLREEEEFEELKEDGRKLNEFNEKIELLIKWINNKDDNK